MEALQTLNFPIRMRKYSCRSFTALKSTLLFMFVMTMNLLPVAAQGLGFQGNAYLIRERTAYEVFAGDAPLFRREMNISFEIRIRESELGHIFTLSDSLNQLDIQLIFARDCFKLLPDTRNSLVLSPRLKEKDKPLWLPVSLQLKEDSLRMTIGDETCSFPLSHPVEEFAPRLFFGRYGSRIDVPAMQLHNLRIYNPDRSFTFPLDEERGDRVHDTSGKKIGEVEYPLWKTREAYYWKKHFSFSSDKILTGSFDAAQEKIYLLGQDSVFSYSLNNRQFSSESYQTPCPIPLNLGMNFQASDGRLWFYELFNGKNNDSDIPAVSSYEPETGRWDIEGYDRMETQRHHHATYYQPEGERQFIFGGFGDDRFFRTLHFWNGHTARWEEFPVKNPETVSPRYFSAMGSPDSASLYLFGGIGNQTGLLSDGKRYLYDLYKFNLSDSTLQQLWEYKSVKQDFVSARQLLFTNDSLHFYTLSYPEYISQSQLRLYKWDIREGNYQEVGDSIPICSEEIATNANLFYASGNDELICLVLEYPKTGGTTAALYSIANEPVTADMLGKYPDKEPVSFLKRSLLVAIILGIGAAVTALFVRKRKKNNKETVREELVDDFITLPERKQNSICLFGEFTVYDRQGITITHLFSTKIRHLFLLILLKDREGGISSKAIEEYLWPEREGQNVKNIKGVTIANLRKILRNIDGIELVFTKEKYRFVFTDPFYCDYLEFCNIPLAGGAEEQLSEEAWDTLIHILQRGAMLENQCHAFFDQAKADFENQYELLFRQCVIRSYEKRNYPLCIRCAQALSRIDLLNETALRYTVRGYLKMRRKEQAVKYYNQFLFNYKCSLNEEFIHSFEDLQE